jgi:phytoene desaturase
VPAAAILAKLEKSKKQYQLVGQIFLEKPLNRLSTWLNRDVLKALLQLKVFNLFSTMHQRNVTELQHPKLVQLFDRYATYNGSSPYKAPALLNMIPHLEHGYGTFLPEGGMTDITNSLVSLAIDEGVQFRFNESVLEILYQQQKVSGVRTANGVYPANRIVSNMDITPTYRKLLPHLPAPEKTLMQERSSAALIFYWGINRQYKMLGLHNILFSEDYQGEFENLFHQKQAFFDPTVYINITSKDIPSDAPEGNENWFVMVNAPENNGQDWDTLVSTFRSAIIKKINKTLNTSIEEFIVTERVLDPRGIEQQTSSMGGSLYGTSSNNRYAAFLRHANQHQHLKGLYFCGGSVHPGGGIPLCLLSGKIVSELILNPS